MKRWHRPRRIKRHIRLIEYNYICGWCEYRKIRPKAIWDFNQLQRKRKPRKIKIGTKRYVPRWMKRGYKILWLQRWTGTWWKND